MFLCLFQFHFLCHRIPNQLYTKDPNNQIMLMNILFSDLVYVSIKLAEPQIELILDQESCFSIWTSCNMMNSLDS